jgi:hypothetical protein
MIAIGILLVLLALPAFVCAAYLFWLSVLVRPAPPEPPHTEPRMKFDLLVPAHNEEERIGETIRSLGAIDYPERLVRVVVIADNCTDNTYDVAQQAGAIVLTSSDPKTRGRGHALAQGIDLTMRDGIADAVVVIQAGAEVSPNLLSAFATRLSAGAQCVQSALRVKTPEASRQSRLMVLVTAVFRTLRSLARQRLSLSVRAGASGTAFSRAVLGSVPQDASSLGREGEWAVRLGMAGYRVFYAHEAWVATDAGPEDDQIEVARMHLGALARTAFAKKDPVLFDLAMEVATPPVTILVLATLLGWIVSLAWAKHHTALPAYVWGLALYFLLFHVVRGWALSELGMSGLASFAYAPAYMVQRIGQLFRPAVRKPYR